MRRWQTPTFTSSTSTLRLVANAQDPDGDLKKMDFYVNGQLVQSVTRSPDFLSDTTYSFTYDWIPGQAGTYLISSIAEDNSGNRVQSDVHTVTATTGNASLPTVQLVSPLDGTVFETGDSISLEALGRDSGGNVRSIEVFVNGVSQGAQNSPTYSASVTINTRGDQLIYALVTDNDGNQSPSNLVQVRVEDAGRPISGSLPPQVTLAFPPPPFSTITIPDPNGGPPQQITTQTPTFTSSTSRLRLVANALDPDGDLKKTDFYVNGTLYGSMSVTDLDGIDGDINSAFVPIREEVGGNSEEIRYEYLTWCWSRKY